MRNTLLITVAGLAVAATTACSDTASEPTALQTEALLASATAWTPSDLTRDLPVDDATRQQIEDGLEALHRSMLELHDRHESALTLDDAARAAYTDDLEADMRALHAQHRAVWDSLDPAVKETLAGRLHERMREHHDDATTSLHERMRRMHGGAHAHDGAHDGGGAGH